MQLSEQEIMIKDLENAIDRLGALYNQYFMGIEKLEPLIPRKDVERRFNMMRKIRFQNTALRFRFQMQVQKFSTQSAHWRRICRQIEEGTYERDLRRAKERVRKVDEAEVARKALAVFGDGETPNDSAIDIGDMMSELDDPFGSGVSLEAQLSAVTALAAASVAQKSAPKPEPSSGGDPSRDTVRPVGGSDPSASPAVSREGVRVPPSSVRIAAKNSELHKERAISPDATDDMGAFFKKAPPVGPPPAPGSIPKAPPPPPRAGSIPKAPPPVPRTDRPAAPVGARPSSTGGALSEDRIQSVYRAYVAARKKTNESTDSITLDKVATLLKKTQTEKGGVSDFKVVIRNGKAVIRTVKS